MSRRGLLSRNPSRVVHILPALSSPPAYSTGRTGHVEVLQVAFDPAKVEYEELVRFFYTFHVRAR